MLQFELDCKSLKILRSTGEQLDPIIDRSQQTQYRVLANQQSFNHYSLSTVSQQKTRMNYEKSAYGPPVEAYAAPPPPPGVSYYDESMVCRILHHFAMTFDSSSILNEHPSRVQGRRGTTCLGGHGLQEFSQRFFAEYSQLLRGLLSAMTPAV